MTKAEFLSGNEKNGQKMNTCSKEHHYYEGVYVSATDYRVNAILARCRTATFPIPLDILKVPSVKKYKGPICRDCGDVSMFKFIKWVNWKEVFYFLCLWAVFLAFASWLISENHTLVVAYFLSFFFSLLYTLWRVAEVEQARLRNSLLQELKVSKAEFRATACMGCILVSRAKVCKP